jgi:type IV pilus assembly protein PilC
MVEGGIPIISAIDTISEDIDNTQLQKLLRQVSEEMQGGEPLSDSLARFPKVFNNLAIAMILAGQSSGNLADALRRLAEYFDNRDKFIKKIKGAMAYPIFAVCFIIIIVIFIMTFIIPRFTMIFDQLGSDLPGFTKGFMAFYDMIRNNVIYIIGGVLLLIVTSILVFRTKKGHYWFCRTFLGLPLIGRVLSQSFVTIFCKTMSTLLSSGVSVLETFDILVTMTNNDIIKTAISQTREKVVEGASVSSGLSTSGFFPNMVVKMIQVGEESGSMSNVLERTANYYERKVDATIDTMMALLEPIMIIVVGAIVLVITLALYLPIFSMG